MARSPNGFIVTFKHNGEAVGVGFLVDRRHILTCAHVINVVLGRDPYAQEQPADDVEVTVEFALVDHHPRRRATVVKWVPPAAKGTPPTRACDIAGLELLSTENAPRGSKGRKLIKPKAHAKVEAYGYPSKPQRNNGGWVTGRLLREVDNGLVQIDSDLKAALRAQPGYSGSPVIDIRSGRAAGILTSASTRDGQRDSYAVTSTRLHKLWPEAVNLTRAIQPPPVPPRVRRHLGIGALLVVLVVLAGWGVRELSGGGVTASANCVPLEVSVSTEKDELIAELAEEYNDREHDGPCGHISVTGFTSGMAKDAIGGGWTPELADNRPEPQVWLPSSSMWTDLLHQAGHGDRLTDELPSITASVLSIAMRESLAEAAREAYGDLDWAEFRELASPGGGWKGIGRSDLGPFELGRDNPNYSTSGLAASVATYYAGAGKRDGITEDNVLNGDVVQFVRDIETSVIRYGDDATTFMEDLYEEDRSESVETRPISAVMAQEQLVHLYNQGALGDTGEEPNEPMVALQPEEGTVLFDHPFVLLSSATEEQRVAAADFHDFLLDDEQQERFAELGFRDPDDPARPTGILADSVGVPAGSTQTFFEPPDPQLVKLMQDAWAGTRRTARVLLVLDVSTSMNDAADPKSPDTTKIELLRPAAKRGLSLLGNNDEVGIWTFAGTVSRPLPMSPVSAVRDRLDGIIDDLPTADNTALYDAIRGAHQYMLDTVDPDKINAVVVLSDGEQFPAKTPKEREALLREFRNLESPVRMFTVPYGANADTEGNRNLLDDISLLTKAVTYDATNTDDIDEVMVSVFSNFGAPQ